MAETAQKIAKRSEVHVYMNTGTSASPTWVRLGKGWKKFSENPNAQTESVQYICDDSATTPTAKTKIFLDSRTDRERGCVFVMEWA